MFNPNLMARLGSAVKNVTTLSVSALTAPMLALAAVTGEALGAFRLDTGPRQVSELTVTETSGLAGRKLADVAGEYRLVPLALTPAGGPPRLLLDVPGDTALSADDRLVVCGSPQDLRRLVETVRGDLLPGVMWAGALRRWVRTARRTLLEVDLSVKVATPILFATVFASTLIFRYGLNTT